MPYCRKCGAKLEEEARFCHVCGTPVAAATVPAMPIRRRPFLLPVIILIALLVTAAVVSALVFLPFYSVYFNQTNQVADETGVNRLILVFQADVARVNVFFKSLADKMVLLNVTASGWAGMLSDPNRTVAVTFDHITANNTVIVTSKVSRVGIWPLLYNLNVVCNIYIDPSATLSVTVRSGVGQIVMNADTNSTFQALNLETTTGSVEASVAQGVVIAGSILAKTTTGSVTFNWCQADAKGNVSVNLRSTTGPVNLYVSRDSRLSGNVSIYAGTTTGSVNVAMAIHDDVGAKIESHTSVGKIDVEQQGFSGDQSLLQSSNYPAGSNFLVNLATTIGGVHINAYYDSPVVLSAWQTR
jgi:hypothetical protein